MTISFKTICYSICINIWGILIFIPQIAHAIPPHTVNLHVINPQDIHLYEKIFALQTDGEWKQADILIDALNDKILMGHVLYQRYMHPTKYRSSYEELHLWMKSYADHPNATKIYKLAQKRRPKSGWKPLPKPIKASIPTALRRTYKADDILKYSITITNIYPSDMRRIMGIISRSVYRDRVTIAYNYLNENRQRLSREAHAETLGTITRGYYKNHRTNRVFEIAEEAYKMHPETSMYASWWAGLEAYRQQQYNTAITYFVRTTQAAQALRHPMYAGAYFWAGRSAHQLNDTTQAKKYWIKATETPMPYRTEFYALLAYQSLEGRPRFDFETSGASRAEEDALLTIPAIARGYALAISGQYTLAEKEFSKTQHLIKKTYQYPLLQMAYSLNLPHMQQHMARILSMDEQKIYAGYAYPDIPYKGVHDYRTNKSFVLAFMRQESSFKPFAMSPVGAQGLMQVMPPTARFIDKHASLGLFTSGYLKYLMTQPDISITLGDAYLAYLLSIYENNIIMTVAGYNAGPGNIKKWHKNTGHSDAPLKAEYNNDPLLLIESIPSGENRQFLENVLSNYWMYRLKENLPTPTLTAIAKGQWAAYIKDADMQTEITALHTPKKATKNTSRQLIKVVR